MIKNTIRIVTVLLVLVLILWGASKYIKPKADVASNPCSVDINALILPDPQHKLTTDKQVVQAMFDHYFSYYVDKKECLGTSIDTAKLASIGTINHDVPGHFLADIIFELKPTSMADTKWITAEVSTTTDGWIKNKKGVLSIRTATTSSSYFLVI